MLIALTDDKKRVSVKGIGKNSVCYCPLCKKEVVFEKNTFYADQFKHKDNSKCDSFEEKETPWSAYWQEQFPIKNREVVIKRKGKQERHKADVKIGRYVVLFRSLSISREEFNTTTAFFKEQGYKVVWIFNIYPCIETGRLVIEDKRSLGYSQGTHWYWKYPRNFLQDFDPKQNQVIVFFHTYPTNLKDNTTGKYLERVIKLDTVSKKSNLQRFTTASLPGSKSELLYALKTNSL